MSSVATSTEIERIEAPSREVFDQHVEENRPFIMTGVSTKWPAFEKWSADYFKQKAGDAKVTVHYQEEGNFHQWYGSKEPQDAHLTFGEFIDILLKDPPDGRYYMTEHDLAVVSEELVKDVDATKYVDTAPFLFLGRDTYMPLHYHGTTEAILCQLKGTKQITLYAPDQWSRLYAHPWYSTRYYFSRVDTRKPDLSQFPKFKDAVPMTFTLYPGEILLIPVHWWHVTNCPEFQISCTMFWGSKRERYTFPTPGIQVYAHQTWRNLGMKPAYQLKQKLRTLRGK